MRLSTAARRSASLRSTSSMSGMATVAALLASRFRIAPLSVKNTSRYAANRCGRPSASASHSAISAARETSVLLPLARARAAAAKAAASNAASRQAPLVSSPAESSGEQPSSRASRSRRRRSPASSPMRASSQARSPSSWVISSAYSVTEIRPATDASASARSAGASGRASASICSSWAWRSSVCASPSSSTSKPGATPASSGKRLSSAWQKAWMVRMLMPPGASSTRANRRRATTRSAASGARSISLLDLLVERGVRRSWPSGRAGRPAGCASRPRRPW